MTKVGVYCQKTKVYAGGLGGHIKIRLLISRGGYSVEVVHMDDKTSDKSSKLEA